MSAPAIGALRHRIAIEIPARVPDGGGGGALAWVAVATVWAEIRGLSGTETVIAEGLQGKVTHEVIIRKRMDVSPANRLNYGGRIFVIWAVLDRDGPSAFIRIQAQEMRQ